LGQILNNLGTLYVETRDLDQAGPLLRQAVEHMRVTHGDRHPNYATAILNLAIWHEKTRQFPEALRLLRECVRVRTEVLGTGHPAYFHALNNLAFTLCLTGSYDEARPLAEQAMAGRMAYGEDHPLATHVLWIRAGIDIVDRRPQDALDRFREAVAI